VAYLSERHFVIPFPHFVIPAEGRGGFKPAPTATNARRHSERSEESLAKNKEIAGQARNDGVF